MKILEAYELIEAAKSHFLPLFEGAKYWCDIDFTSDGQWAYLCYEYEPDDQPCHKIPTDMLERRDLDEIRAYIKAEEEAKRKREIQEALEADRRRIAELEQREKNEIPQLENRLKYLKEKYK